ncbi:EamA family transporter [Lacticigenium naphthae]|uniref:EamA family transporter n=1 Tax=Lacticigenium naphthae TaxID=515351 RepID=UPI0003F69A87|nr:EamA family transporter [Lacticigenium naphthae]
MWFTYAIITVLAWGTADLFYKKGNKAGDRLSHLKTVIMVGLVMGLHAFYLIFTSSEIYDPINMIRYFPVSAMYILSMAIGYAGLRYIELSISSPVQNSSGAVSALLTFVILGQTMTTTQFFAVTIISVGIILLGVFEKQLADRERLLDKKAIDRKYRLGALALVLPILYAIIDAMGTFLDGYVLTNTMSEMQANVSYELTFLICGLIAWAYLKWIKNEPFTVIDERANGAAAIFETIGQFFYVYAMASNAIVVAPLISSYSMVSVILSRIFLKEKLSKKQYLVITAIMVGIAILGME